MSMKYFPIFLDFGEMTASLTDEEVGRLIKALLKYASGDEYESMMTGNEKFLFPVFSSQYDRFSDRYEAKCEKLRQNASKGGLKKQENKESKSEQTVASDSNCEQNVANATNCYQIGAITKPITKPKTNNKTKNIYIDGDAESEKKSQDRRTAVDVIGYLNEKANRSFRCTDGNIRHIRARIREGYSLDDFKTVIDRKVSEWSGTDYDKYLRPETLFGTKFDSYLNAKKTVSSAPVQTSYKQVETAQTSGDSFDLDEFMKLAGVK